MTFVLLHTNKSDWLPKLAMPVPGQGTALKTSRVLRILDVDCTLNVLTSLGLLSKS